MKLAPEDKLFSAVKKLRAEITSGGEIPISLPEDSEIFGNILSLEILKHVADECQGSVVFEGGDETQKYLAREMSGERVETPVQATAVIDAVKLDSTSSTKSKRRLPVNLRQRKVLFIASGGALLFIALIAGLLLLPKATITLNVDSEALVKSYEVSASPSATNVLAEARVLPAVVLDVEERSSEEALATGKKEKGTKASGEVTIYNWTNEDKSLDKGTTLTLIKVEGDKIKFLLDEALKVPAQTASVSATSESRIATYVPGKKTVTVTAEKYGEEYNLTADSKFSVASLATDEFLAQNKEKFIGGKREEIKIVTKEDQDRLLTRLKDKLESQARDDIVSRAVGDQKLPEGAVYFEIVGQTFDKKVDEEAENFSLNLTVKGSGMVYSEAQLKDLIAKLLEENVPSGFHLADKDLSVEVSAAKMVENENDEKKERSLNIISKVRAAVTPELNEEQIRDNVRGKDLNTAKNYLEGLPNISTVKINLFPSLPGPFGRMPRVLDRIDIKVEHD